MSRTFANRRRFTVIVALVVTAALTTLTLSAQLSVRPEDPSGTAIREKRVRVVHSTTPDVPGTSMYLQQADPWLAYQRGRSYYFHEWGNADGAFRWLPFRPQAAATTSCGMCHNLPFPSAGSGGNIAAASGIGRNTPALFGDGLLETMGMQVRAQAMAELDTNHNGYIDYPAEAVGRRLVVEVAPGVKVDYGSLEDLDHTGRPALNSAVMVVMVDKQGRRLMDNSQGKPAKLGDPEVAGFEFAIATFASSAGDHQFPSLRFFSIGVLNNIMGILPAMEVTDAKPRKGVLIKAWGTYSNAGALQTDLFLTANPAPNHEANPTGTISEGEMDLFEWYLLNHPQPAHGPQNDQTRRGRLLMTSLGCTSCHVQNWVLQPQDTRTGMPGDRRFFNLDVNYNPQTERLEGKLQDLTHPVTTANGTLLHLPRRAGFVVEDVYTDLAHHDLGPQFWEYTWNKDQLWATKSFRTAPLWGIGSTAPYGHDGMSPTLDDVIRRHGGEAQKVHDAYVNASQADRDALVAFLESLVLYRPETLPTDINGDGKIDPHYQIAGTDMGPERFQPELMFKVPPRYRGWTTGPDGDRFYSYELLNEPEAYGERLPALLSSHGDGIPDIARQDTSATVGIVGPAAPDAKPAAATGGAPGRH